MVKQASLLSQLESIVGADGVRRSDELSAFAVDGLTPQAAVAPSSYEQVAEVLRYAHTEGLAVIPRGSGTHMHIGNVPSRYDIGLSLLRLDQVVEHEPADLTVTCQAGITLDRLQRHLGQHGQLVPLGPAWGEEATIGGILAANASGPSRHAYGAPRDFTIGMKVVTADGRITKAGGRVVKNVAGYDLCKLYIGSLGTLGVIVEASFKLAPMPKVERTAVATFDTPGQACAFAADLQHRRLSLRAVQLLNATAASAVELAQQGLCALVLDLAGTPQAVERSRREIGDLAQDAAADLRDEENAAMAWQSRMRPGSAEEAYLLCKATALPTHLPALIESLETVAGSPHILALPTVGVLYASWPRLEDAEAAVDRLHTAVTTVDGSLVLERCPLDIKPRLDVFGDPPPSFDLMRRVKEQFDPKGILSPGRQVMRL
ncbi:MAG: FAD-binding oxidoreductase [Chloroflexi bacterium]|nr:FAD-binding oxidoreductase [Chloroflexota bacterium]